MVATVATVYPGFLIGALAVQVSNEFSVSESLYGWGLGGFFLAATAGSVVLGRLVQRIGPRRQILGGLAVTAAMSLFIAGLAAGWWQVVGALAVCGVVNAGNQTAVNLALTRAEIPRLGLAIALKQSGMPTASMLSGFMVPALALTVGWRWAYVLGASLAVIGIVLVARVVEESRPAGVVDTSAESADSAPLPPVPPAPVQPPIPSLAPAVGSLSFLPSARTPVSTKQELLMAAVAGGCLSFAAGALNAWIVSSGVDAGLGEGSAGLMLSLGAATGITLRVVAGTRLDRMRHAPFKVAGLMVLFGAAGVALLTVRSPMVHVAATVIAFAGGWVWPVFTNYGIVRANRAAAGAATGITQMGVYVGVFAAPLTTGWLIEGYGYPTMWLAVAAMIVVGSIFALSLRHRF